MKFYCSDVHKFYGQQSARVEVLKGVDCIVEDGEICILLGPSGSGKSTLLNILGGLEHADGGHVQVGDKSLEQLNDRQLNQYRRNDLGFVFQFYDLIPDLTVRENIEVCAWLSSSPLDIDHLLEILGLKEHQDKLPSQLSGGQQQRTAIGRALVKNPKILLCDEPTGALDFETSRQILQLIQDINKQYGTTVLIVTHNNALAQMAHRVYRMHDGQIASEFINTRPVNASTLSW